MSKKTYTILFIIVVFLAALRFFIIPSLSTRAGGSCAGTTLSEKIDKSTLIIVGRAVDERVDMQGLFNPFTYTTLSDTEVIRGNLETPTLQIKQAYGCDVISGYCVWNSAVSKIELGEKYLLFLKPAQKGAGTDIEQGVYIFSICGGLYPLRDEISSEEITEIINSDESRWEEFVERLYDKTTQSGGSPGKIVNSDQAV